MRPMHVQRDAPDNFTRFLLGLSWKVPAAVLLISLLFDRAVEGQTGGPICSRDEVATAGDLNATDVLLVVNAVCPADGADYKQVALSVLGEFLSEEANSIFDGDGVTVETASTTSGAYFYAHNTDNASATASAYVDLQTGNAAPALIVFQDNGAVRAHIEVTTADVMNFKTGASPTTIASISTVFSITPLASAPASCAIGNFYVDTSGAYCSCSATNTWTNMNGVGACT